jgi:Holliday junction DNA helicase RuvA
VYDFLEGRVVEHGATRLVVEVGGVGWELAVPLGHAFPVGAKARVWTQLIVREDSHQLFGFAERPSRELFRQLLRVRGVGPGVALGVLSGLPAKELFRAVVDGDAARLTAIRGVGQKTAQQILLDLRDKLTQLAPLFPGAAPAPGKGDVLVPARPPMEEKNRADAVAALVSIGFSEKEAQKGVERAIASVGLEDLEVLVRTALAGS